MITADKKVLSGTSGEIREKMENLLGKLDLKEITAGGHLRTLAAELAQRNDLTVSVITYDDQTQELEVSLAGLPDCVPIIIERDTSGDNCQMFWECWLRISDVLGIQDTADLAAAMLRIGASRRR